MKKPFQKLAIMLSVIALITIVFTLDSCKKSSDTTTTTVIVLDGYYVKGAGTAYADFNEKATMKIARNEVTQTDRASLLELYIPVKAGAAGFNIVKVAGSSTTVYGPGTGFTTITTGTIDEPKVPFQRGPAGVTGTVFTVPADGMYHVVFDYDLNIAVVAPVHWGMIGAALALGWGTSTDLTESAFNLTTMSWTASNLTLTGGDWKFRYSNGWKIVLDTVLDLGGGNKGVRVNTNFGGAVNALVAGGPNIVNAAPGIYTALLSYTVGSGYTATLTKTGDLAMTNWTGVRCDAVGDGIDSSNLTAHHDTSSWNWGNQMLGDNGGIPTKVGNVYTWTWTNIILKADQGFKIRTVNGVAPPSGGANFDAGFAALDAAASSTEIYEMPPAGSGNLATHTKASYTITLTIDAANADAKKIVITKP